MELMGLVNDAHMPKQPGPCA